MDTPENPEHWVGLEVTSEQDIKSIGGLTLPAGEVVLIKHVVHNTFSGKWDQICGPKEPRWEAHIDLKKCFYCAQSRTIFSVPLEGLIAVRRIYAHDKSNARVFAEDWCEATGSSSNPESNTVAHNPCCGCSCTHCEDGHNTGNEGHTEECKARMFGDTTPEKAKAYGKRRTAELVSSIDAIIEAHSGLPEVLALRNAWLHIKDPFLRVVDEQEAQRFQDLTEQLAALEHAQWAHWTEYMIHTLMPLLQASISPVRGPESFTQEAQEAKQNALDAIKRWGEQISTPYADLSEDEKNSDREWAGKVLEVLEGKPG